VGGPLSTNSDDVIVSRSFASSRTGLRSRSIAHDSGGGCFRFSIQISGSERIVTRMEAIDARPTEQPVERRPLTTTSTHGRSPNEAKVQINFTVFILTFEQQQNPKIINETWFSHKFK
jgi:hypothetical protein